MERDDETSVVSLGAVILVAQLFLCFYRYLQEGNLDSEIRYSRRDPISVAEVNNTSSKQVSCYDDSNEFIISYLFWMVSFQNCDNIRVRMHLCFFDIACIYIFLWHHVLRVGYCCKDSGT